MSKLKKLYILSALTCLLIPIYRYLLDGAELVAIHRAKYYKKLDGLAIGPGPFVSALEEASGVKAKCVGKPEAAFFEAVLEDMACRAEDSIMIGDVCEEWLYWVYIYVYSRTTLIRTPLGQKKVSLF